MFTYLPALDLSLGLSCQWPRGTTEGPAQGVPVHNISSKFHTLVYYTLPPPRKVPESEALSVCASAGPQTPDTTELRSCVEVEVAVWAPRPLTVFMVFVDVKRH